ncbi:MAG: hypothetical protein U0457_07985 [Candidatus Sericytochromatia bacterium]
MSSENELKITKDLDESIVDELLDDDIDEYYSDIISHSNVHDRFQFESKFDFDLNLDKNNEKNKKYYVDFYFFIPKSIGINSETYTRDNFYSDLTNYLRIRTPEVFNLESKEINNWSLYWSDKYFKISFSTQKRLKLSQIVIYEVKLFGCFINTQLKKLQNLFYNLFEKERTELYIQRRLKYIETRLDSLEQIILKYREKYTKVINENQILIEDDVKKSFIIVDEFISYRLEFILVKVLQVLRKNSQDKSKVSLHIKEILKKEIEYRISVNFINFEGHQDNSLPEMYYYRMGLLKKYVLGVLYLQSEIIKKEKIYRNLIAATGAALAASWAVMTDIQRINLVNNTKEAGIRLLLIFFIGISAYVFKDRIKELSKEYFNQKLKKYIPDLEKKIFYDYFDKEGQIKKKLIAISNEFMRYLNKENIPEDILYIRDLGARKDIDPERNDIVINYSKRMLFDSECLKDSENKINFIRDISRFAINDFLDKLDDPDKILRYFDSKKGVVVMEAPKVYHINVIMKYKIEHEKLNKEKLSEIEYERIRIVLNKRGIVRIEKVISRGEIKYVENKTS